MKYLKARFKNYIGFYNGMGLEEVDIDFTKCIHNIILINGKNGSGKSTLLYHLNPFPDGSASFIPNKSAEKELIITNGHDIYNIQIISPADIKGRKTTKAYIQKNGIELNENGNVSSYKDTIYSEFELDSNYLSLSRLSSTDKGLGDKTPAERKRFASNIIDSLEIYNSMYKSLNKKSLIYKSHTNTLHTKIQNIGNKEGLEQTLSSLKYKESELNKKILELNNTIVAIQAKNSIDEDEAKYIQEITTNCDILKNKLDLININLDSYYNKTKIKKEEISDKYNYNKDLLNNYNNKNNELNNTWKDKCNRLSDISNNIRSLEANINNIDTDNDIYERYQTSNKSIEEINCNLKELEIPADINLIIPITNLISFCNKFIELVDRFYDDISGDDIDFIINIYSTDYIDKLLLEQKVFIDKVEKTKLEIEEIQNKIKKLSVLESRPNNCKIDSCPFISEALSIKKNTKNDILEELSKLQEDILSFSDKITEIQNKIDYAYSMSRKNMELGVIRSSIFDNKDGISIFYPELLENLDTLLINTNTFGNIRDNTRLLDGLNLLKILDKEIQNNKILEAEYKGYREKIKLINSNKVLINKLKNEQEELSKETNNIKLEIDNYSSLINNLSSNIITESKYNEEYNNYLNIESEYKIAKEKVEEYQKKSSKAISDLSHIKELQDSINKLNVELNPVLQDISTISGKLALLDSYYIEYNEYKKSYDIIETLKKYCSPTGAGIQTLFIQLYMGKTKDIANEILMMLFNGNYQLLDFVINENEFRIPFIGEGLPVDDISSGSSSQISMMSMIINLVLLNQASTTFNIAQLDEVDGPVDSYNRSQFVNVLFHSMTILNIEQLFLISHSIEINSGIVDVINLKGYDDYESSISNGNIIWDYYDIIKTLN